MRPQKMIFTPRNLSHPKIIIIFARMNSFKENVILADADYVDRVVFDLTVNFERIIGRRIPKADLARWADCIALDGGIREGANEIQVILIHDSQSNTMTNFLPGDYKQEIDGKAFKDHLGEFTFEVYPVDELTTKDDYFTEVLQLIGSQMGVHRVMVIPDSERIYNKVRATLNSLDDDEKRITVFNMQPSAGGNFRQEILGYSLMSALGIRSEELDQMS